MESMQSIKAQMQQMRQSLDQRPEQIHTGRLAPIFVPASFFAGGNWCGPFTSLRAADIGLTWTVLQPNQTMRYVDFGMQEYWDAQGLDWRALALQNLREHTGEPCATHRMNRPDGALYAVAFMHSDALGPSRLLFRDKLSAFFPHGYRVAIPEMSCAFAWSVDIRPEEMATVQGVIDNCFRKGTRPLAGGSYDADDLLPGSGE